VGNHRLIEAAGASGAIAVAGVIFIVTQGLTAASYQPEPTVATTLRTEWDVPERLRAPARPAEQPESMIRHGESGGHARKWLLPNVASQPPEDLVIAITEDGARQLRFASIIGNTGIGPIETVPNDSLGCPPGQRHASQIIYHDVDGDGTFDRDIDIETTNRPAGCMLHHPEHDHWHFDGAAWYVLTETRSGEPIVSADKVSFCWRDNREVASAAPLTYDQYYPVKDECGNGDSQGITPGWADVYSNELADQHLNLPNDLASGVYCLWNSADPYDRLIESDDTDNTAVVAVEIIGAEARIVLGDDGCDQPPDLPRAQR
jgi:hypothetical protein